MDTLTLRLVVRIAELGGLSAAARDLGISPASASTRLGKLESSLGVRLFHRTTRAVSLTGDGADFLPYAQEALEALDAGLDSVSGRVRQASGSLRMTLPGSFGRMHVVPRLAAFRERHPEVTLDLRLSDAVLDVVKGAFDLVIRNAELADSSLVARRLADDERVLVASPDYLARAGTPRTPRELTSHDCVAFPDGASWAFADGDTVQPSVTTIVDDGEAMRALVEDGAGIALKSLWNVAESLRAGRLVTVLPEHPTITRTAIWAIYPRGRLLAPRVRAMIDFLLDAVSPTPPWLADAGNTGRLAR